jgi:uncharacterized protein YaiL (DUF2058 family)
MVKMRKKKIQQLITRAFAVMLSLALAACASTQIKKVIRMERLLTDSGFKMRPADTPEKLAQVRQLLQHKLITHQQGDKVMYIYADADHCKCVYTGDEEAYQQFADKKQVSGMDRIAEDREEPARLDWGEWRFNESW